MKNELVSPNLKSHAFSRSPSKKNSISQASNSDDDEEQIDENESQIKQNIVPEKANSQMISPSPAKNNSFGFVRFYNI